MISAVDLVEEGATDAMGVDLHAGAGDGEDDLGAGVGGFRPELLLTDERGKGICDWTELVLSWPISSGASLVGGALGEIVAGDDVERTMGVVAPKLKSKTSSGAAAAIVDDGTARPARRSEKETDDSIVPEVNNTGGQHKLKIVEQIVSTAEVTFTEFT